MKHSAEPPPIDWAMRVNRAWIVQGNLSDHAEAWLDHLAALEDERLQHSCECARAMCEVRDRLDDPKPWFYAGLFSNATTDEARRFLEGHRITKAAIPSMKNDKDVKFWMDRVGPETRNLILRLRQNIARVCPPQLD